MKKVIIPIIASFVLCSCSTMKLDFRQDCFVHDVYVSFSSYEDLVNEMKAEDEFKKNHPFNLDGYYTNFPMYDAKIEGAILTKYLKFGMTTCLRYQDPTFVLRYRFAAVTNDFDDYSIALSFWNDKNVEDAVYDTESFEWNAGVGGCGDNILYSFMAYCELNEKGSAMEYPPFVYRIKDSNNNYVVGFFIKCKGFEKAETIFNKYKDEIMQNCKEMI